MFDQGPVDREHELRLRVAMALTGKFWPVHFTPLLEKYASLSAAFEANNKELNALKGLRGKVSLWRESFASDAVDEEIALAADHGVALLMPDDSSIPPLLSEIVDPPLLLWVSGAFADLDQQSVAIVGSRSASHYGLRQARLFAEGLARQGFSVVSGLARGIDTVAHQGALEAGGRTLAVLGSGHGALYPKENKGLAEKIAQAGAVISEFPINTKAHPSNFPRRNRIVAGLSRAVLVAQAGQRSGSLITARLAQEQGREVFALPARVEDDGNEGSHALIRKNGAALVTTVAELLEDLGEHAAMLTRETPAPELQNEDEAAICALLKRSDPTSIEEIIAGVELDAPAVSSTLMMLEMRGVVAQLPGKAYLLA